MATSNNAGMHKIDVTCKQHGYMYVLTSDNCSWHCSTEYLMTFPDLKCALHATQVVRSRLTFFRLSEILHFRNSSTLLNCFTSTPSLWDRHSAMGTVASALFRAPYRIILHGMHGIYWEALIISSVRPQYHFSSTWNDETQWRSARELSCFPVPQHHTVLDGLLSELPWFIARSCAFLCTILLCHLSI